MEYFLGSVKLMLIVYALAAVIAIGVAWIIKLIFAAIRRQRVPAAAPAGVPAKLPANASAKPEKAA